MHATEYYSAWKRKAILKQATPWVNLEDIMPGSRSQKDKYCVIPPTRDT